MIHNKCLETNKKKKIEGILIKY